MVKEKQSRGGLELRDEILLKRIEETSAMALTRTVRALATYSLLAEERDSRRAKPFLQNVWIIAVRL